MTNARFLEVPVGVKENYLKSAHDAALAKGGLSCVTYHSAHKQQKASISLILTHVVDVDLIFKETEGIQGEIGGLKNEISSYEKTEIRRKIFGSAIILFFILGALIFWLYRNTALSDE